MIVKAFLTFLLLPMTAFLNILPALPDMNQTIIDGGAWITEQFQSVLAVLNMFFGTSFVAAILIILIALINFQWIYNLSMWALRKIPFVDIT